jgi:hypothetical protein
MCQHAEDEHVFLANLLGNLNIGACQADAWVQLNEAARPLPPLHAV